MKVNSHPTLSIPRNFTFFSIPTIFIHPNLLHSFSLPLTHFIPRMPCGPLVYRAPPIGRVLRYMRRDVHPAQFSLRILACRNSCLLPTSLAFPPGSLPPSAAPHLAPLFRSPRQKVSQQSPLRFSIITCPM